MIQLIIQNAQLVNVKQVTSLTMELAQPAQPIAVHALQLMFAQVAKVVLFMIPHQLLLRPLLYHVLLNVQKQVKQMLIIVLEHVILLYHQ